MFSWNNHWILARSKWTKILVIQIESDIPRELHPHLESRESFEAKELEKWKAIEKIADLDVHTHNKAQKFPTVTNKESSIISYNSYESVRDAS